jgi:VanZ family protein
MQLILACLTVVLTLVLFPYEFGLQATVFSWKFLYLRPGGESDWEIVANILLYLPLGFAMSRYLCAKHLSYATTLLLVLGLCFALSYLLEALQFFLPSRFPSWRDVASNTLGGVFGTLIMFVWEKKSAALKAPLQKK